MFKIEITWIKYDDNPDYNQKEKSNLTDQYYIKCNSITRQKHSFVKPEFV